MAVVASLRGNQRLDLAALVDEDVLQLPIALRIRAGRADRGPLVHARNRVFGLPHSATPRSRTPNSQRPNSTEHSSGVDNLVLLRCHRREVVRELRGSICPRCNTTLGPPSADVAHGGFDEVSRVNCHPAGRGVRRVAAHLSHIAARMVKRLAWPISEQHLPFVTAHASVAWIEGAHGRRFSGRVKNGRPSATSLRDVIGSYESPRWSPVARYSGRPRAAVPAATPALRIYEMALSTPLSTSRRSSVDSSRSSK